MFFIFPIDFALIIEMFFIFPIYFSD
jgi:hypothetical protein